MLAPFFTQETLELPLLLTALIGGYLSGSVPFGLILSRLAGLGDIRQVGSGNIGATNVLRVGGKKLAIATLLLDALKGAIPVLVAKQVHMDYAVIAALAAFCGHLFPVWLKFRGGKGVATALGISFAFCLYLGLMLIGIWLLVAVLTKYSSASALTAFLLAPLVAWHITDDVQITATMAVIALLVWIKHHENIRRLLSGTEGKINLGKK